MRVEYTLATKGIHGGYSNIKSRFSTEQEVRQYSKKFNDCKVIKITWLDVNTCKEEIIR